MASPFTIPSEFALSQSISIACQIYAPQTEIGKHIRAVYPSADSLPPLVSYQSQITGLLKVLKSDTFQSLEEFNSFLANVLWESMCLTSKADSCVHPDCPYYPYQGRGYIHLTGRDNYQDFSMSINRPEIMSNPGLISSDETLAWQSAIYFWSRNCKILGAASIGSGNKCINAPECTSSETHSPIFSQFGPIYRLRLGTALSFGNDTTVESKRVCEQMNVGFQQCWTDFCEYHGSDKSVNCLRVGTSNGIVGSTPSGNGTTGYGNSVLAPNSGVSYSIRDVVVGLLIFSVIFA